MGETGGVKMGERDGGGDDSAGIALRGADEARMDEHRGAAARPRVSYVRDRPVAFLFLELALARGLLEVEAAPAEDEPAAAPATRRGLLEVERTDTNGGRSEAGRCNVLKDEGTACHNV